MRSGYSDVNWFLRAARVVPVVAGAALLGGMIGGFAMFAIDSALTWQPAPEPASQPRREARADSQASAVDVQTKRPVRIVGGAIPDPSAGMSAPPPAPQQQRSAAVPAQSPAQSQISSQLLTPKPLGPASQLQPQTAAAGPNTVGPNSRAPQPQNQTANQAPVPAQAATTKRQEPTHWPDALSRAHQDAAKATSAPQQTAPPPATAQTGTAQTGEQATTKTSETDQKAANSNRAATSNQAATAATADDPNRGSSSSYSRSHFTVGTSGSRNGENNDAATAPSPRRQDARGYDRLYDSYGKRRDRSYSNTRGRSYGDTRYDQYDSASRSGESRSDTRRYGRDTGYRGRSRAITRETPGESDRNQGFEGRQQRSEPFWGGGDAGFFRRGYQDEED